MRWIRIAVLSMLLAAPLLAQQPAPSAPVVLQVQSVERIDRGGRGGGMFGDPSQMFDRFSKEAGKEQYLIPYFIAAHPGTRDEDMLDLAIWLKKNDFRADQVQAFLPSPMATATAMLPGCWTSKRGRGSRRFRMPFLLCSHSLGGGTVWSASGVPFIA